MSGFLRPSDLEVSDLEALQNLSYISNDAAGRTVQCNYRGIMECRITFPFLGFFHLPLEDFRLEAERSSAVVALQLHCVVGGERRLSVRGRLQRCVLRGKARNDTVK